MIARSQVIGVTGCILRIVFSKLAPVLDILTTERTLLTNRNISNAAKKKAWDELNKFSAVVQRPKSLWSYETFVIQLWL